MVAKNSGTMRGRIYRASGLMPGALEWHEGRVSKFTTTSDGDDLSLIIPSFVDLHCHGGGGADFMSGGDAAHIIARAHAKHGTSALLATTMTAPVEDIEIALRAISYAMKNQSFNEATILGVHLEGPFISRDQLGAQPDFVQIAELTLMKHLCSLAPIKVVTMAPEADPDFRVSDWLRDNGVRVQIGHTACTYDVGRTFLVSHADGATHLFNAMSGFHHRNPGCVGACFSYSNWAEFIPDLLHVNAGAIRAACRAIPNCYAVTDATAAAAMPDGPYHLGRQIVFRSGNAVRLASGGLAGSCLTMAEACQNLLAIGFTVAEAVRMTSKLPLNYLSNGTPEDFIEGVSANFVEISPRGAVRSVILHGNNLMDPAWSYS